MPASFQQQSTDEIESLQASQRRFAYLLSEPQVILYLGGMKVGGQIQDAGGEGQNFPTKKMGNEAY